METRRQAAILKVSGDNVEGAIDEVASELPVRIEVNGEALVSLLCTPAELKELAIGFLLSEGILGDGRTLARSISTSPSLRFASRWTGFRRILPENSESQGRCC